MKKVKLIALVSVSVLAILFIASLIVISSSKVTAEPTKINYLGLAKLGVIPTNIECKMAKTPEVYFPTNVTAQDSRGNRFMILQNKLGQESCVVVIK